MKGHRIITVPDDMVYLWYTEDVLRIQYYMQNVNDILDYTRAIHCLDIQKTERHIFEIC